MCNIQLNVLIISIYYIILFNCFSHFYCWDGEVVVLPYMDAVVDVTVMRVLLFVLHVCMLRECEGARMMEMIVW